MKNCKMAFTIGLVFAVMMLVADLAQTATNQTIIYLIMKVWMLMNMCIRLILILEMI